MVTHFLVLVTAAVLSGQEAPDVVQPHKNQQDCLVAAASFNVRHSEQLNASLSRFACVSIVYPAV